VREEEGVGEGVGVLSEIKDWGSESRILDERISEV
jgi:hypothetical protein